MSRKTKALEFVGFEYPITVTGRNVHVTDTMKQYAVEKISKLETFNKRLIEVWVTMDIQKINHRVDIGVKVNNHTMIKSHASTDNMYASIDLAVDKLQAQIRRYKQKLEDHHKSIKEEEVYESVIRPSLEDDLDEINEQIALEADKEIEKYHSHEVVKKEIRKLHTLPLDRVIMNMELMEGEKFMLYRSEEDQKIKLIYRRDDGNYGIIEPQ